MSTSTFGSRISVPSNVLDVNKTTDSIVVSQGGQNINLTELTNTNISAPLADARGTFPTLPADYATANYPTTSVIDD
jgi:hypothetical protein